jgi:hypothetical protein
LEVVHHAIIGRRRYGQETQIPGQCSDNPFQQTVMGTEIVAPVGNAMGFVDHEERNPVSNVAEDLRDESFVRQPLWRDQENIDIAAPDALFDSLVAMK